MKKIIYLLVCSLLVLLISACGESEKAENVQNNTTQSDKVDIDLTEMTSTMEYAQAYQMLEEPDKYEGKTVRIKGRFVSEYNEQTKKYYHFITIADETQCCQQGMEFIWNGEHTYPDDYPPEQTEVETQGVFKVYEEDGYEYFCLFVDELKY